MEAPERKTNLRAAWASVTGILLPVSLFHRVLISVGISDLVLCPAVLVGIQRGEWRRWIEMRRDPLARWVFGFAIATVIGIVVGYFRLRHLIWWALVNRGVGLLMLLSICCLFASVPGRQVWFYLRCFLVAGSLLNLAALGAVVLRYGCNQGSVFFFGGTSLRLSGLMHNPNQYGGYLAVLLTVQLSAVAYGKSVFGRLWVDTANSVALLLASLFTISRGSWLATLAGVSAVLVVARVTHSLVSVPRRQRLVAPAAVAVCLAVALMGAQIGGAWPASRLGQLSHTSEDTSKIYFPQDAPSLSEFLRVARDPSGAGDRLAIARTGFDLYMSSPLTMALGLGLGGFAETAPTTSLRTRVIIHNSFLWALVELGPLGAICTVGIFQATLRRLWSSLGDDADASVVSAALFAALISVLVWCLSNDGMYQRHLWFLLGLAIATAAPDRTSPGQPCEGELTAS